VRGPIGAGSTGYAPCGRPSWWAIAACYSSSLPEPASRRKNGEKSAGRLYHSQEWAARNASTGWRGVIHLWRIGLGRPRPEASTARTPVIDCFTVGSLRRSEPSAAWDQVRPTAPRQLQRHAGECASGARATTGAWSGRTADESMSQMTGRAGWTGRDRVCALRPQRRSRLHVARTTAPAPCSTVDGRRSLTERPPRLPLRPRVGSAQGRKALWSAAACCRRRLGLQTFGDPRRR
jgi:hypothetical protein